ncbi:HAD-IA family hydrolase [Aquipuribacter nitratireducens]|uniref:HAD family hydrolase n=1 Tax=Aquipuribacter nitratireducens TaxID=650104 RepID=A0ABW0GMF9_9MICO
MTSSTAGSAASSTSPPLPAAVLWDMDGTLVDTEPLWLRAETDLVTEHGGRWTLEDGLSLVGNPLIVSGRTIVERTGIRLSPQQVVDALLVRMVAAVRSAPPFRPGARELLEECVAAGVPAALVTMSYADLAGAVVDALPPGTFTTVVTGDAVVHGKPHPEPFLTAAARLGVDPSRCVALEDSVPGVASAEAAGCRVVAVPLHVPLDDAPGRSRVRDLRRIGLADLAHVAAGRTIDDADPAGVVVS